MPTGPPVRESQDPLTPEEEEGIRKAVASKDAGRLVSHQDVRRSVDELLERRRSATPHRKI
jgi:hypothetical protein